MRTGDFARASKSRREKMLRSTAALAGVLEIAFAGLAAQGAATVTTWTGVNDNNNFDDSANWSVGLPALPPPYYDGDFNLSPSDPSYNGYSAPNVTAAITMNGLIFDAAGWTISGTSPNVLTVLGDGITIDATGTNEGDVTISAPLDIGASESVDIYAGNTLTLSGAVSSGSGDKLNATGPGTILLNGTASSLGDINASAGTVLLDLSSGTTGGKLEANGSGLIEYLASSQLASTGVYRIDGSGDVNLNGFSQSLNSISLRTTATAATGTGAGDIDLHGGTLTLAAETTSASFDILTQNSGSTTTASISSDGVSTSSIVLPTSSAAQIVTNDPSAAVDLSISAAMTGGGTVGLSKTGLGALSLSAANTYTGPTTITVSSNQITYGTGTLELDFSQSTSPASNILYNGVTAGTFNANGGALILNGGTSAANSQQFSTLSIGGAAATSIQLLNSSQNLVLNVGAISRGAGNGSTVDFVLPTGTQSSTNGVLTTATNSNGIIGPYATVGGQNWATNSGGNIIAFAGYTAFVGSGSSGSMNYLLSGTGSVTTAESMNTLKAVTTAASQSLTLNANLTAKGLLFTGGTSNSYSITGTGVLTDGTTNEFIANVASGASLTVSSPVVSSTATTGALTKAGTGMLILSGTSAYAGATYVDSGTLALSNASNSGTPLGNTAVTVDTGATLAVLKNSGNVSIGSGAASLKLQPGATLNLNDGTIGTFTINQTGSTAPLTLAGDDTLDFDLSNSGSDEVIIPSGGSKASSFGTSINGFIATNPIDITPISSTLAPGTYPLISAGTGSLSLSQFSLATSSLTVSSQSYSLSLSAPNTNTLDLTVALSGPVSLTWNNAAGNNLWDTSSVNWNNGSGNQAYADADPVTFNDNNPSSTAANYAVTLNTTVKPGGITVNASGNYTISGSGSIAGSGSLTKSGTGTLMLSTTDTYSGGTTVNNGKLLIEPTSTANVTQSALPSGALTINGGVVQIADNVTAGSQPTSTPASNVNITSLSISGNGTLDIGNNQIIIDYGSLVNDPIASIAAWIKTGYAGGAWTGSGIISSDAQSNPSYGIGYADAADPNNPAGLSSGQIELKYTLLGDANLDDKVNGADFTLMAANFNDSVTNGWDEGDFNYSGTVNGDDFVLLADNFNDFASQSAVAAADLTALDSFAASNGISLTSVPEPASMGLLALGTMSILSRRRRRKAQ